MHMHENVQDRTDKLNQIMCKGNNLMDWWKVADDDNGAHKHYQIKATLMSLI